MKLSPENNEKDSIINQKSLINQSLDELYNNKEQIENKIQSLLQEKNILSEQQKQEEIKALLSMVELLPLNNLRNYYIGTRKDGRQMLIAKHGDKVYSYLGGRSFHEIHEYFNTFFNVTTVEGKHQILFGFDGEIVIEEDISIDDQGEFYPHAFEPFPDQARFMGSNRKLATDYDGSEDMYIVVKNAIGKKNILHVPAWKSKHKNVRGSIVSTVWFDDIPLYGQNARPKENELYLREVIIAGKKKILNLRSNALTDYVEKQNSNSSLELIEKKFIQLNDSNDRTCKFTWEDLQGKNIKVRLGKEHVLMIRRHIYDNGFKQIAYITVSNGNISHTINKGTSYIVCRKDIDPQNTHISRKHCEISFSNDSELSIKDLNSTNGTFIKVENR